LNFTTFVSSRAIDATGSTLAMLIISVGGVSQFHRFDHCLANTSNLRQNIRRKIASLNNSFGGESALEPDAAHSTMSARHQGQAPDTPDIQTVLVRASVVRIAPG
jgi:hypothetical protein